MTEELIVRREGAAGFLTLNRPKAIHALTADMDHAMTEAMLEWRDDEGVAAVIVDHSEGRGFCAGGDIAALRHSALNDDGAAGRRFFFEEYQLNHLMFTYAKPIVAFMDGITMGGGVGISLPARYRVATERTVFAMPETGIGLFPDVGGGWFLPRMPGHAGLWLALTGARIKAADCELLGVATDFVESSRIEALKAAIIADPSAVETALTEFEGDAGRPPFAAHQDQVDSLFGKDSVEAIVAALETDGSDWARAQLDVLATKSPQTLKVAFRQLQLGGAAETFADNMRMEYRIGARVVQRHDFIEGVRAVIVDKDNAPKWNPPTLSGVDETLLDGIFAPLPDGEEWSPLA